MLITDRLESGERRLIVPLAGPDDTAFLPFSSGTTGHPKPVILTHANAVSQATGVAAALRLDRESRLLGLAPLFHVVGPMIIAIGLLRRIPVVLIGQMEPKLLFDAIETHRVSHCPVLPPILKILARHPLGEGRIFAALRLVACSGDVLPPGLQETATARLGAPAVQVLGMTEAMGGVSIDRAEDFLPGSVGFPFPNLVLRIADPETETLLGPGAAGEIQIRGPMVTGGFFELPEETAALFTADGWLRTGDLGEVDGDGRIWVRGRLKELIKVHAGQVPPAEIEMLLMAHPAVADVAIVGRPNAHSGEIPVAYIVWAMEADPQEVMAWVNDQLLPYKQLRAIETIEIIPRNSGGKILRHVLAAEEERRRGTADCMKARGRARSVTNYPSVDGV